MYITVNNHTYQDVRRKINTVGDIFFSGESLTDIAEVSGEIVTYRNDGFELARDITADYQRTVIADGAIKLTNYPDPEPVPSDTEVLNELLGV